MLTITLIALLLFASCGAFENQELKPCFERYDHQKLIDSEPFHSEWRMKNEEDCLPFCALSSSRCRSIVYDVLNHICHYFSEEGLENAVIARRMTLFRVANRQCLLDVTKSDEVQEGEEYDDEFSHATMSIPKPPTEEPAKQTESLAQLEPTEVPSAPAAAYEVTVPVETTDLPPEEAYDIIDDAVKTDGAKASSVHEVPSDDSDLIPASKEIKSEVELPPAPVAETTTKQSKLITLLTPKESVGQQKESETGTEDKFKPKLVPLLASRTERPANLKLVSLGATSASASNEQNVPAFLPPMTVFKADRISKEMKQPSDIRRNPTSFSKAIVLKKSESAENGAEDEYKKVLAPAVPVVPVAKSYSVESDEQIRPKPTGGSVPTAKSYSYESVPAYIPKARGFLKSVNGNKNPDVIDLEAKIESPTSAPSAGVSPGSKMFAIKIASHVDQKPVSAFEESSHNKLYDECASTDSRIWLGVENAEISSTHAKNTVSADDVDTCKQFCITANKQKAVCSSFTFYETEKLCVLHSADDGFNLKKAASDAFTTRSYKKFCYPEKLSAFKGCTDFIAFRDYTLEIEAKEEFDGMPKGIEGLQACVELCVHSPDFRCKSAAFDMQQGQCFVYDENSFTKPTAFREHLSNDLIYFENGCDMWFTEKVPAEASIKRVASKTKPVAGQPQGQKKPSYMLFGSGQVKHLQFNPSRGPVA